MTTTRHKTRTPGITRLHNDNPGPNRPKDTYYVRVTFTDPVTKQRGCLPAHKDAQFDKMKDAEAEVKRIRLLLEGGSIAVANRGSHKVTVDEAIATFLQVRHYVAKTSDVLTDGTVDKNEGSLQYLSRVHGPRPVADLTTKDIQDVIVMGMAGDLSCTALRRPWRPATTNLFITAVRMMLDQAVKDRATTGVAVNVSQEIKTLRITRDNKYKPKTFTVDEMIRILEMAKDEEFSAAWWLALHGFRRGEIAGLRWKEDVDFDNDMITIQNTRVYRAGHVYEKNTKSGKSRKYPIGGLREVLLTHQMRQEFNLIKHGRDTASGYVITDELGQPVHPQTIYNRWGSFLRRMKFRYIRLHDCRHTFGTLMAANNDVSDRDTAEMMGHASLSFYRDTYVQPQEEGIRANSNAWAAITSRALTRPADPVLDTPRT